MRKHYFLLSILVLSLGLSFAQTLSGQCMPNSKFPTGYVPFSSIYYISAPDEAGDLLVVGSMTAANYLELSYVLLPNNQSGNQLFCNPITLAPGIVANAYVPTAAERLGDFAAFTGPTNTLFFDPTYVSPPPSGEGDPPYYYPGGVITPTTEIPTVFAWRIPPTQPGPPVYVSTGYNGQILAVDGSSGVTSVLFSAPSGEYNDFEGLAIGPDNLIYVTCPGWGLIFRIDQSGGSLAPIYTFPSFSSGLPDEVQGPSFTTTGLLDFNTQDNEGVWQISFDSSDTPSTPVEIIPPFTTPALLWGGGTTFNLAEELLIAEAPWGSEYVVSEVLQQSYYGAGTASPLITSNLSTPLDVAVNSSGNIFVPNLNNYFYSYYTNSGYIAQFDSTGYYLRNYVAFNNTDSPTYIQFDASGRLYVVTVAAELYAGGKVWRVDPCGSPPCTPTLLVDLGYAYSNGTIPNLIGDTAAGVALAGTGTTNSYTTPPQPLPPPATGGTVTFTYGNITNQAITFPAGTDLGGAASIAVNFQLWNPTVFNATRLPATSTNTWSGGTPVPNGTTCTPIAGTGGNCIVIEDLCYDVNGKPILPCQIFAPLGQVITLTSTYQTQALPTYPGLIIADDGQNDWANITVSGDPSGHTNGLNTDTAIVNLNLSGTAPTVSFTGVPATAAYQFSFDVTAATSASATPVITATAGSVCTLGTPSPSGSSTTVAVTMTSGTGTCNLTAFSPADTKYAAAYATAPSVGATKINPAVAFTGAPASEAYYSTFTVTATTNATSTATITASGVCTVGTPSSTTSSTGTSTTATVTMTGSTGTCTLTASWAADNNYLAASFTQSPTTASQAPLTITASNYTGKVYGTTATLASTAFTTTPSPLYNSDSVTSVTLYSVGAAALANVGSYAIVPSSAVGTGLSNYNITYATTGTLTVVPATTTTTLNSSVNPSTYMQLVTFTATVAPQYSGTPTGTVAFYNNGSQIGTGTLSVASCGTPACPSQATFSTASLPSGTDSITATYSGDSGSNGDEFGDFLSSSTSVPLTQTVSAAPVAYLSPLSVSFGNQNVKTTSGPAGITLTNIGDAAMNINGISITGANPGDFAQTNNCVGSSVAAEANCTITVTFTPIDTGVRTAALQITDNDDDMTKAQQLVSLTGAGLSTIIHRSLFSYAFFAEGIRCDSITMGGGSTVDSFDSSQGFSSSQQLSGGNVATNGNVTLNGSNTEIYGSVTAGGCGNNWIGQGQASGGFIGLNGPINFAVDLPAYGAPPTSGQNINGSCASGITGCTNNGSNSVALAPGQYGNLSIRGGTAAHFAQGSYNINSLTLTGNSILYVDSGPVVVNLAGASLIGGNPVMDLSGGSIQNPSGIPANLQFAYTGSQGMNLSGGPGSYATVYAPNALVNLASGSDFFGAIIGSIVTNSGGTKFHYDRHLPYIQAGDYIWFDAVVNHLKGLPSSGQVKLYLTDSTISFTAASQSYTLPVPKAVVTFNSTSTNTPNTIYDLANNRWSTSIPSSGLTGNTFVTGVAFQVPTNFPTGIQNVAWSAAFTTDTPGITLQWQWGAAVYSLFSTTYATTTTTPPVNNVLGVNPEDGSADINNADPAGTPETYKADVIFGGTGGGWINYTGYFSPRAYVIPTPAPMAVSPSSLDFGTQSVGTTTTVPPASLTNNDTSAYTITGISIAGTDAGDFAITTNTCLPPSTSTATTATLAGGTSCTITVVFTPSDVGTRTAEVVINDTAKNSPQTLYLTGTGD